MDSKGGNGLILTCSPIHSPHDFHYIKEYQPTMLHDEIAVCAVLDNQRIKGNRLNRVQGPTSRNFVITASLLVLAFRRFAMPIVSSGCNSRRITKS